MPDTVRSFAELNAMFPDNDQGSISPQDVRDLITSMMVGGEIGSGTKSAITLSTGWNVLDFNVAGTDNLFVNADTVNKQIDGFTVPMVVEVAFEILFQGANNTTFNFAVFKNPATDPQQITRLDSAVRIFSAAMVGVVSVSSLIKVAAGDVLQAGVNAGAVSFTLLRGGLRVKRHGPR